MSVRNNTPPTPRKLNPQVDSELELICLKCIERDPDDRYSSAAALASDLENWLAMRRWRRAAAAPNSAQLDSKPVTPAPV